MELPGDGSIEALRSLVEMQEPANLTKFLAGFAYTSPTLAGDLTAIQRIAVEFCEDAANNGVLYVESRFCPHLLLKAGDSEVTADDIVEAVLKGFKVQEYIEFQLNINTMMFQEGEARYGLTARVLLCCIRGLDQFHEDVLRLCVKYRDQGVVGMDIAGRY